jgi:hypothetical protein
MRNDSATRPANDRFLPASDAPSLAWPQLIRAAPRLRRYGEEAAELAASALPLRTWAAWLRGFGEFRSALSEAAGALLVPVEAVEAAALGHFRSVYAAAVAKDRRRDHATARPGRAFRRDAAMPGARPDGR